MAASRPRVALIATCVLLAGWIGWQYRPRSLFRTDYDATNPDSSRVEFVGSEVCGSCHATETQAWQQSQHRLAMQPANEESVLGDFTNASFEYFGVHSRFFREDGRFLVETDGPDGKLAIFAVKYVFGFEPLQQYLIEFPDGRLQALSLAWDSRKAEAGGQRWFHLYPDEEIRHDDVLHWTKLNQNWNFMCAECHSTGVRKNYDAVNDRFATEYSEISVGCEACHGQGSRHVRWARSGRRSEDHGLLVRFQEPTAVISTLDSQATQVPLAELRKETETCGLCHARRAAFSEDWIPGRPLSSTHEVSTLSRELYFPDGQMRDEVYNYGSFKQSKMFAAGVTCGNCHDPHTSKLRLPGDQNCLQCHTPEQYDGAVHSHHTTTKPSCVACHMPTRTYMVVDPRHDHSFRVPRPDLSERLGTPNACNACHSDRSSAWAAAAVEQWYGPEREGFQTFGPTLHAAWTDREQAGRMLAAVAADPDQPAIVRATALTELSAHLSSSHLELALASLRDPDPMVRVGAVAMLEQAPTDRLWPALSPLLSDPSRGVRIRVAALLARVPDASQPAADRERFARAAEELVTAQHHNFDRPEARLTLGNFYARRGRRADAENEYKSAIRLSGQFAPAYVNLADLYREMGKDAEGERILREAIRNSPRDAGLHHVLGLTLVRLQQSDEAMLELERAVTLDPEDARYAYVYAVALHSSGQATQAIELLERTATAHPNDTDVLIALVNFERAAGNDPSALKHAERLARVAPNLETERLLAELRARVAESDSH